MGRSEDSSEQGASSDPRVGLLRGGSTRDILRRIFEGDPLGIWKRGTERIAERALLMDATRLFGYAAARIAYEAVGTGRIEDLEGWLAAIMERAIDELLSDDQEFERAGMPLDEETLSDYEFAAKGLGLPKELARRACVVFNTMPEPQRVAVWALTVEGATVAQHARDTGATPRLVREYLAQASRALDALGVADGT